MQNRFGHFIRRTLCLMLILMLLPAALAGAQAESTSWLYTFTPQDALEGKGTETINELLDALQLRMTRQLEDNNLIFQAEVLSEGDLAISITGQETPDEVFALQCSLTGDHVLLCQREQIPSFLLTLVQVLADRKILRGESLDRVSALARRGGDMLVNLTSTLNQPAETITDYSGFLKQLRKAATAWEEKDLNGSDPDCPDAAKLYVYHLSEEDLNDLVNLVLGKFTAIPVLSNALSNGSLHIGKQVITDSYIRELFKSMHGESVLYQYDNADGQLVRLYLQTPDISALTEDPDFAKVTGVDLTITRTENPDGTSVSITDCVLPGLDKAVMRIRMDKQPGAALSPLSMKNTHQVGEMNSTEMMELIHSMGLLIVRNAVNMILVLPRCVFELLIDKLF